MVSGSLQQTLVREQITLQRQLLSLSYQDFHLSLILDKLLTYCLAAEHVAFYYPINNEVNTRPLWQKCHELGIRTYLPRVAANGMLLFDLFDADSLFVTGAYDIPVAKPLNSVAHTTIMADQLDLVVMPLIACDRMGHRIGMGGGFYDKTFAFKRDEKVSDMPILLGVGWDFQLITEEIVPNEWDVPLSGFISESYETMFSAE